MVMTLRNRTGFGVHASSHIALLFLYPAMGPQEGMGWKRPEDLLGAGQLRSLRTYLT